MRKCFFIMLLLFVCCDSFAMSAAYNFSSKAQQQMFIRLTQELRCVVCETQSLAESNAPLAQDIKQTIYVMLMQQQSEQAIKQYMVERYGDSVLYKPPLQLNTMVLWVLPFVLLAMIFIGLPLWIKRRYKQ